ncbi:MAG: hypothetical protein PSV36_16360 [Algoriphagus sp.]|nr:hypothetical protein [Algoriphagus sp.]
MDPLTKHSGKELFECHDSETIRQYLWEIQKGWVCYLNKHLEGEDPAARLFFFELLWNLISEHIPPKHNPEKP